MAFICLGKKESPLDVASGEIGEMTIEDPVFGPLLHLRIVQVGFGLVDYPADVKAVAARDRLEDVAGIDA